MIMVLLENLIFTFSPRILQFVFAGTDGSDYFFLAASSKRRGK